MLILSEVFETVATRQNRKIPRRPTVGHCLVEDANRPEGDGGAGLGRGGDDPWLQL